MHRFIYVLIFAVFAIPTSNAQSVNYSPEVVVGNRSTAYQHLIAHTFNNKWSINNVTLFDTEYNNGINNIFFIRNMVSYSLNKHLKTNIAIGVKNPGVFTTLAFQYQYSKSNFKISYAIGSTYQNTLTLEQTLMVNYTPKLNNNINAFINLFAVVNTNLKILDRSLQQLRFGIKKEKLKTGIAVNLDQFTKAEKTLENFGLFIKYNF